LRNVGGRGLRVVMRHRCDGLSDAMSVGENKRVLVLCFNDY